MEPKVAGDAARGRSALLPSRNRIRSMWAGKAAIALLLFLSIGALYGGWALVTAGPGESPLGMPLELLEDSPFTSYFIPGLLLFGVFGVGSIVAALAGLLRHWAAPYLAFTIGVGQMIWIGVEVMMLPPEGISPLQPLMFGCGALIATSAYLWWRYPLQVSPGMAGNGVR